MSTLSEPHLTVSSAVIPHCPRSSPRPPSLRTDYPFPDADCRRKRRVARERSEMDISNTDLLIISPFVSTFFQEINRKKLANCQKKKSHLMPPQRLYLALAPPMSAGQRSGAVAEMRLLIVMLFVCCYPRGSAR